MNVLGCLDPTNRILMGHQLVLNIPETIGQISYPLITESNKLLSEEVETAIQAHEHMNFTLFDYVSWFDSLVENPESYGFTNMEDPACKDCQNAVVDFADDIVSNPEEYFFWDSVHLSASAHRELGDAVVEVLKSSVLIGDFDKNEEVDAADIDLLSKAIREASSVGEFDIDSSGVVDGDDLNYMVEAVIQTWIGDSNLDGEFNSNDLVGVFQAAIFETGRMAGWNEGDWNGDGVFDTGDLVLAFQEAGFEQGPRTTIAKVPEPTGGVPFVISLVGLLSARRAHTQLRK